MKIRYLTSIQNDSKVNKFPTSQVVFATVIGVSTLILSFLLYFCIKRIRRKRSNKKFFIKEVGLRRFSFVDVEKATKCFSKESMIGSGAFGNVYKGIFDGEVLAIKRKHVNSYENQKEFKNEINLYNSEKEKSVVNTDFIYRDASISSTVTASSKRNNVQKEESLKDACKKLKKESSSSAGSTIMVRKQKLGDRIATLQQLASPFGKSDTASVLQETLEYIHFLQNQIQDEIKRNDGSESYDLRKQGLSLVPVSCIKEVEFDTNVAAYFYSPATQKNFFSECEEAF